MQKWAAFLPLLRTEEGTSLPPVHQPCPIPLPAQDGTACCMSAPVLNPSSCRPQGVPEGKGTSSTGDLPVVLPVQALCRRWLGTGPAADATHGTPASAQAATGSPGCHPTPNLSPFRGRGKQGSGSGQGLGKAPLWDPSCHSRRQPPQPAGARQGSQGTGSPLPPPTLGAATRCQHLLGVLEVSGCSPAKGCAGSFLDPVLPSAQQQLEEPQSPFHSTELSK